jgi:hypothetical protein
MYDGENELYGRSECMSNISMNIGGNQMESLELSRYDVELSRYVQKMRIESSRRFTRQVAVF